MAYGSTMCYKNNKNFLQHGFAKSGAELQASTFGILLSIIVNLSIRISNSPPSASPKPLAEIV
jgi:hypothetical protein